MNTKFSELNVPLLAICSTDTLLYEEDSFENMVKKAHEESFNFPYLYDSSQQVAKDLNTQKIPHAFAIWKESGSFVVEYEGSIDDNGAYPETVKNRYVEDAVLTLLNNSSLVIPKIISIGCQFKFESDFSCFV